MGTNFYCKHIPTGAEYAEMQKALAEKQLDKLRELLDKAQVKYHIGKRSAGWAFLFQGCQGPEELYDREPDRQACVPWEDNLDSLQNYLKRSDVQIVDEYGTPYTFEEFWKEIEPWLYVKKGFDSAETYYRKHPDEFFYAPGKFEKVKNNTRWSYQYFS